MAKKKLTFEEALKELESLAEKIERGDVGLEESIEKYEEGMSLVRRCREILQQSERRIQALQEKADGTLETAEFEGADELRSGPGAST